MLPTLRSYAPFLAVCGLLIAPLSCGGEEEVELEVDERGVWELKQQDVTGQDVMRGLDSARVGKYFLYFKRTSENLEQGNVQGRVVAATCIDAEGITSSPADNGTCEGGFRCDCYDYSYSGSVQNWAWVESSVDRPEVEGDTDTDGGDPDEAGVGLMPYGEAKGTYRFSPLPLGLMGCETNTCQYAFQSGRAESTFEKTGCLEFCKG